MKPQTLTPTDERIAAASSIDTDAKAPPPLPLAERVRLALQRTHGDVGGEPLLLAARLYAWAGRSASPEEIVSWFTAAGMIASQADQLRRVFTGELILATDGGNVEFFTASSPASADIRGQFDANGEGCVDLGYPSTQRLRFEHPILLDEHRQVTLHLSEGRDGQQCVRIEDRRDGEEHGRGRACETLTEAFQKVAEFAFEAGARQESSLDPDYALFAIRTLKHGQSWTELLFDASPYQREGRRTLSLRASVERHWDGTYATNLDLYGEGANEGWIIVDDEDDLPNGLTLESPEEVAVAIAYYRLAARCWGQKLEADAPKEERPVVQVAA